MTGVETDQWARWMIAIAVMVSAVMEPVDTAAVYVSLPYPVGHFSSQSGESTAPAAHQALALIQQLLQ